MGNEKDARELINENLTDEEMQDLMASYKKELAHVYKMASAKKRPLSEEICRISKQNLKNATRK